MPSSTSRRPGPLLPPHHLRTAATRGAALAAGLALALACGGGSSGGGNQGGTNNNNNNNDTSACVSLTPATSAAQDPITVIRLGTRTVGSTVQFSVPEGAASVTVIEQAVSARETIAYPVSNQIYTLPNAAVPLTITDANGRKVFDDLTALPNDLSTSLLYYGSPASGAGAVTIPNTSAGLSYVGTAGLPGGNWSLVVSDWSYECYRTSDCAASSRSASSTYDVTVVVKPGAAVGAPIPTTGTVDLRFYVMPAQLTPEVTAASAANDVDVQRFLLALETILSRAGVALGSVTFEDLPDALATRLSQGVDIDDASTCGDLAALFAAGAPGRQVNLFLVPNFITKDVPAGTAIAGIDGTIPGPATVSPTINSGAAISIADLRSGTCTGSPIDLHRCGADFTAYIAAHELGHFFGLYHVTESDGSGFDPLSDTATCDCTSCNGGAACTSDTAMGADQCTASATCGGGDDLMFWIVDQNYSQGLLSDEQIQVIRANPAVY